MQRIQPLDPTLVAAFVAVGILLTIVLAFFPTIAAWKLAAVNKQPKKATVINIAALVFWPLPVVSLIPWGWSFLAALRGSSRHRAVKIFSMLICLFLLSLGSRVFFFQTANINGYKGVPTLYAGDFVLVSRYDYGYSRFSLPFLSPFVGRVFARSPQRGDLVLCRSRFRAGNYFQRVIGLPGDTVQMIKGNLYLNGKPVASKRVADFVLRLPGRPPEKVQRWRETLPDGVSYDTVDLMDRGTGFADQTMTYNVPPGHYFLMGDDRDAVADSRYPQVGFIPASYIIGKIRFVLLSVKHGERVWEFWRWPVSLRWNRLFKFLH